MGRYAADQQISVNGVSLHYAVEGSGHPVVLIHGNGESHDIFDVEIAQLAEAGYSVYAPDSRGHGANPPMNEYHYMDMAEDVFQFIRALGLDRPYFYGHSDGGIIGLLLEINHPGTLSKMAISGTNLRPEGLREDFLREWADSNRNSPNPLVTLMLTEPDIDPESLRSITIPVLVTVGSDDLVLPEETRRIVSHLPHARLEIVEGADHGSYIVDSDIMGGMLLRFFEEA
ncbi:MAG: alpha/beta hydrolase [Clostridia bacterium]|nr:alpha/beta hydrolase [Clostridia bacterium]